jgi:hypothetical protein
VQSKIAKDEASRIKAAEKDHQKDGKKASQQFQVALQSSVKK